MAFCNNKQKQKKCDALDSTCVCLLPGRGATGSVTPQEEEELRALSASPNVYGSLARSVAPSIYGSEDLKKAITCLLFGGSRKR